MELEKIEIESSVCQAPHLNVVKSQNPSARVSFVPAFYAPLRLYARAIYFILRLTTKGKHFTQIKYNNSSFYDTVRDKPSLKNGESSGRLWGDFLRADPRAELFSFSFPSTRFETHFCRFLKKKYIKATLG